MQKRVVMEGRYTVCQHSTPYIPNGPNTILFGVSQYSSAVCFGSLLHEFHYQHLLLVSENRCNQLYGRQRLFKLFGLSGECVHVHCFENDLVSVPTIENQASSQYD
jgi:hypothetical protein